MHTYMCIMGPVLEQHSRNPDLRKKIQIYGADKNKTKQKRGKKTLFF